MDHLKNDIIKNIYILKNRFKNEYEEKWFLKDINKDLDSIYFNNYDLIVSKVMNICNNKNENYDIKKLVYIKNKISEKIIKNRYIYYMKDNQKICFLNKMPSEIIYKILNNIEDNDIINFMFCSKYFLNIIYNYITKYNLLVFIIKKYCCYILLIDKNTKISEIPKIYYSNNSTPKLDKIYIESFYSNINSDNVITVFIRDDKLDNKRYKIDNILELIHFYKIKDVKIMVKSKHINENFIKSCENSNIINTVLCNGNEYKYYKKYRKIKYTGLDHNIYSFNY